MYWDLDVQIHYWIELNWIIQPSFEYSQQTEKGMNVRNWFSNLHHRFRQVSTSLLGASVREDTAPQTVFLLCRVDKM